MAVREVKNCGLGLENAASAFGLGLQLFFYYIDLSAGK